MTVSFRRIINTPKRGIGEASLERFLGFVDDAGLTIMEGLSRIEEAPPDRPCCQTLLCLLLYRRWVDGGGSHPSRLRVDPQDPGERRVS